MAQKNNIQFSIRAYTPADWPVVASLFRNGVLEHVFPAFFEAMSNPDHVGVALSISMAGYVLGGSSCFQALLFGGAWLGLVYYFCRVIYEGYVLRRLSADMADIQACYLENPNNAFWVAEAEVNGRPKVVGMVAVVGKTEDTEDERVAECNGGVMAPVAQEAGGGGYAELAHMVVSFPLRRKGLGSQLTQKALDFCEKRGYTRFVVDTSSPQMAANSLYLKFGFVQTASHSKTHANHWLSKLARITVIRMEKYL